MSNRPHVLFQSADIKLNFKRHTLIGRTTLWVLQDAISEESQFLYLNCRQCKIETININGIESSFVHCDALKNILGGSDDHNTPSYNGEELDLSYRAALEISQSGELRIEVPNDLPPCGMSLPKLPRRVPKDISSRFEKLAKTEQNIQHSEKPLRILVVSIKYMINEPLDCWGGWSFGFYDNFATDSSFRTSPIVCSAVTRHSSKISLRDIDGVRTWLPCIDDPGRQSIFDISITVPTYCISDSDPISSSMADEEKRTKYRVNCSGVLVSYSPVPISDSTGLNTFADAQTTYRYITPHRIPACAIGAFIGVVKYSFSIPLYQAQGHIWLADDCGDGAISLGSKGTGQSQTSLSGEAVKSDGGLAASVKHSFLGFDMAVRHVHKALSRRYPYARCPIIFVSNLECDFLAYDGFFCVDYKWLHSENCIFMETSCHVNLIQAYLYTWMKSSFLVDSYSSEFLLHGSVGYLLSEYIEHIFGADEARYRFYKQLQNVIAYEKTSNSFSLSCPFPEDYLRCCDIFSQYLKYKSVVLFHVISHRVGGNIDVVIKAIRNFVKSKEILKLAPGGSSSTAGQSMAPPLLPPPTPSGMGFAMPSSSGQLTPMLGSVPGTPQMVSPLWTGSGNTSVTREDHSSSKDPHSAFTVSQRKRSDSVSSVSSEHGEWKMDPSELSSTQMTVAEASPTGSIGLASGEQPSDLSLPPPPSLLTRQSSTSSSVGGTKTVDELLWGTDFYGGNTSGSSFLAVIREMSGGAGADLNDSFLEHWVNAPGCMFLRAGVQVDLKNKKVDIALHQVGFRSGEIDSSKFIYKDKISVNVVESEVWQYSRRVDGHVQIFSLNIHPKSRRHGGRRRSTDEPGSSSGLSVDNITLSDVKNGDNSEKLGRYKYLSTPGDVKGGRVQAQAINALKNEAGGINGPVQFVAIDPDINWIREIHLSSPDSLLIEQLYMDMDVVGQVQAMRALVRTHVVQQTIPSQVLRLRALKDVLVNAWNSVSVTHSLCVRAEAAYALAQWQNGHAPHLPPAYSPLLGHAQPSSGNKANIYEWAGMEILLGCLRGMFMEAVRMPIASKSTEGKSSEFGEDAKGPRIPQHIPLGNCFEDETKTTLRSALLVSLASIKAGNGCTPEEIIDELLNFAENNDNSPPSATHDKDKKKDSKSNGSSGRSYDDAMYCATLLYCLSMVASNDQSTLLRVIDCAKYYLDRERIVSSSMYEVGSGRNKGIYRSEEEIFGVSKDSNGGGENSTGSRGKSGIVTAMALQCICNAERHLDITLNSGDTKENSSEHVAFNYKGYICSSKSADGARIAATYSPIVRASALDCAVRLAFAKHTSRMLEQKINEATASAASSSSISAPAYTVKRSRVLADSVGLILDAISYDPSRYVRRSAALSFLYTLQDRESFIPLRILSMSEPMNAFNWTDPSGLVVYDTIGKAKSNYSQDHRKAFTGSASGNTVRSVLKNLWGFIASSSSVACDQSIRSTLMACWMYTFYNRRTGQQKVPKCLQSAAQSPASQAVGGETSSYKDKFSTLLSNLPSAFGFVKDPVESSSHLEEALRVGSYGRQMVRAEGRSLQSGSDRNMRGHAPSQESAGMLKLSRKIGNAAGNGASLKRDRPSDDEGGAVKRPRVVKFVMS